MLAKRYFHIQRLCFSLGGIDTEAKSPKAIIKRPLVSFIPLFFAICHILAIVHYAYRNRDDYLEVADSLTLFCQSSLAVWKMIIFLAKRRDFVDMISNIHLRNMEASGQDLSLIVSENIKDDRLCTMYFRTVVASAFFAFLSPIFEALYILCRTGKLFLRLPYKASYFWNHSKLPGYSMVYVWNILSIYNLVVISLAVDTLFNWLVSNISAQFHVLNFRFKEAAKTTSGAHNDPKTAFKRIRACIIHHNQTLDLANNLNKVYGEVIFFKFIITCSQICCLVFRLSRPSESMGAVVYQCTFLVAVLMQLTLYCYNGQRIKDESLQVASEIYFSFDWSDMKISHRKLLFLPIMRSQRNCEIKGVFFVVDLSLFLWVLKTAGSLITALKTLEDNQA